MVQLFVTTVYLAPHADFLRLDKLLTTVSKPHSLQLFTFKHTISTRIKITNQLSDVSVKHLTPLYHSTQLPGFI